MATERTAFCQHPSGSRNLCGYHEFRETCRIKTLILTDAWKDKRYTYVAESKSCVREVFAVENVLGLYSVRFNLRGTTYLENIINSLPPMAKRRFAIDADKKSKQYPNVLQQAQNLVWNRDSIDDIFLVLVSSMSLIGKLFKEVLTKEEMYPLLMAGDQAMRDNSLIVFLLLLMLNIRIDSLDRVHLRLSNGLPLNSTDPSDLTWAQGLQGTAWESNRPLWTRELCRRINAKYGSASKLFAVMGVSTETRDVIKGILLPSETTMNLIDF